MPKQSWKQALRKRLVLKPHHPYLLAGLGFVVAYLIFTRYVQVEWETYKQLRGSLFTGFFAVAGFLLSAKTLVILNMKKEVYAEEWYLRKLHDNTWSKTAMEKRASETSRKDCGAVPHVYKPLAQIGTLLSVNIVLAILASFSQISFGLIEKEWTVTVCMSMAFTAAILLACSVFLTWLNFQALYRDWESIAQEKLDKLWATSRKELETNAVQHKPEELPSISTVSPTDPL